MSFDSGHTDAVNTLWFRTHNLSKRAAADLHFRPRGHWDWRNFQFTYLNNRRHIALFYSATWLPHTLKFSVTILKFRKIPKFLIVDLQIQCVSTTVISQYSYQISHTWL